MTTLRQTLTIARREASAYLAAPIATVVLVLFLVVEGFSFFAVVRVLADPRRPAPYGAVLRSHFGGTFLYWAFLFFVVAATTMRLVAEEKRQGTWEALRTAPVSHVAIVAGKWLGALGFYVLLWLPTLLYVVILAALAPPGAAPDGGPIATAYLGVVVTGAAFLAVGLAASALTRSQLVAAIACFVPLLALLLAGLAPQIAPETFARHPDLAAAVAAIDLRRHMDDFARGIVDTRALAFHGGLLAAALATAGVAVAHERRRDLGAAVFGVALVVAAALLGNVLVARHPARLDATRAHVYTLDERTRRVLLELDRPVQVLVVTAGQPEFAELYDVVRELLARFQAASPRLSVTTLDPALDPGRVAALAAEYALTPEEVAGGGAVVFRAGARRRAVALLDMAAFAPGEVGGKLVSFRGEEAFAAALLEVSDPQQPEVCFTTGHGELPLGAESAAAGEAKPGEGDGADLARVARALGADGLRPRELPTVAPVPAGCAAVAIFGPRRPFAPAEVRALGDWLGRGGRLLVAVDAERERGELVATGLEPLLAQSGVRLRAGVVVDPGAEIGAPLAWATLNGYAAHPITAAFRGRRVTIWYEPRWLEPLPLPGGRAEALVSCSAAGWAETDLADLVRAPAGPDARDEPGPVAVAVAAERDTGARVVVLGSARSFASAVVDKGGADDALVASALAWLTGRIKLVGVGAKSPEQMRIVLDAGQERRLFWVTVLGIPALAAAAGALAAWRRRRP
jgi:ABC-2 type transport system permease protein